MRAVRFLNMSGAEIRSWRGLLMSVLVTLTSQTMAQGPVATPINNFDQLRAAAHALAAKPYEPQPAMPDFLRDMTYDQFRFIGFDDAKTIWGDTARPFRMGFYHKGYVHHDDVTINLLVDGKEQPLPFTRDFFRYRDFTQNLPIPDNLGFAGFRVSGCFPGQVDFQEIFSFVGASYFRARNAEGGLGTSARGLAVNVGMSKPEEFPVFREFWIAEPKPDDTSLTVLALLDGPSVSGAYEFWLTPGISSTDIDVRAALYFRSVPDKIGIAPMSSMWMWGDGLAGPKGDHRPEVHDADGLQIEYGDGQWLWRALCRQNYPSIVQFKEPKVRGFGLLQRDRNKSHYLDDEATYHSRPGLWIEPKSGWGEGRIELLELPAPHEGIDNVAAWWVPDEPVKPLQPIELSYKVYFCTGDRANHKLGKATGFRVNRETPGIIQFELDFAGEPLAKRAAEAKPTPQLMTIRGELQSSDVRRNSDGSWTTTMAIKPTGEGPLELRVALKDGETQLTEIWAYLCPLEPPPISLPPWRVKEPEKSVAR